MFFLFSQIGSMIQPSWDNTEQPYPVEESVWFPQNGYLSSRILMNRPYNHV